MLRLTLAASILVLIVACSTRAQQHALQSNPATQTKTASEAPEKTEPQALTAGGEILGKRIDTKPGMDCLVCGKPIGKDDYVFMVQGQRVAVHQGDCYTELLRHPYRFLEILQPHGAFLGAGAEGQKVAFPWFLVGLYILTGLVFGGLAAHQAMHRGRSPVAWFGWGLALNVLGYLLLLTRPAAPVEGLGSVPPGLRKLPATAEPVACPQCGKTNHPSADRCTGCGAQLQPSRASEVEKAGF